MAKMIRKELEIEVQEKRANGGRILINTGVVDRDKDRVLPTGAQIDNYMRNPVVQWGHNYQDPWATIGKTTTLEISEAGIVADFELRPAANESDPQHVVQLLWDGGWVRTASIGFIPSASDENEHGGRDFAQWELLEWSLVPIPANQEALRLAVKGLGIAEKPVEREKGEIGEENGQSDAENGPGGDLEGKPYPNEHACRLRDPDDFQDGSFRRVDREHEGKRYSVILGKLQGEDSMTEQAYRYPDDIWEVGEARSHCKSHDGIEFSPATGEGRGVNDEYIDEVMQKFSGSPRNPFGTHSSYQFKGGQSGYKRAWRLHFSQINGGGTSASASGPIRGTIRRIAMIAAGMKPKCTVVGADSISARDGPASPLEGSFPEKPGDYGLNEWKKPETDADREGVRFSCSDLNVIKRAAVGELKWRIDHREDGKMSPSETFWLCVVEQGGDSIEPEELDALAREIGELRRILGMDALRREVRRLKEAFDDE